MFFKKNESKLHEHAKDVLKEWIENNPELLGLYEFIKVHSEYPMCAHGKIWFTPDLVVFDETGIRYFIEVFHKHRVPPGKMIRIIKYLKLHEWKGIELIEISASWIMSQCSEPKQLVIERTIKF
jgi:hypothetical protein